MTADQKPADSDWSLLDFARQLAGLRSEGPAPEANDGEPPERPRVFEPQPVPAEPPKTQPAEQETSGRKLRTPDEIAEMITTELRAFPDCPERGFVVTVYGSNPWNAMLTIRPEAGRITERELWLSRVQEMGAQLQDHYDVIETSADAR
jgi:hypothetical protein